MASQNTETLAQSVRAFKRLPANEQLAALGSIYTEIGNSISFPSGNPTASGDVQRLIEQVKQMRQENQLQFLQDVLSEEKTGQEAIALDPHPSKAMLELTPGGITPPLEQYNHLDANSRLAFWYYLAQQMGRDMVQMPANYSPSSQAESFLSTLRSSSFEQQIEFLRQVI